MATMAAKPLHVRTPLVHSAALTRILATAGAPSFSRDVWLKLDALQPTGSFKIRGIGLTCLKAVQDGAKSLVASSGGNAGQAVAYAGAQLGVPATVFVPSTTSTAVQDRIRALGASVEVFGSVWDETDAHARLVAAQEGAAYIHPFDQATSWQGHASLVEELYDDLNGVKPSLILVSVGGGGLLKGVYEGLDKVGWADVPVVACETLGADSFSQSFKAGQLVTLPGITSLATTLGAKTVASAVLEAALQRPTFSVTMTDRECIEALCSFADDHRLLVEPSCAASLAPLYRPALLESAGVKALGQGPVVGVVCGGSGSSLAQIAAWRSIVGLDTK